jgi:hypothetical protein
MRAFRLAFVVLAISKVSCPGIGKLLRSYGYTELRPPSTLLAPGTMVWVRNSDPFTAGIICTQRASLGGRFAPLSSRTASATLSHSSNKDFSLDAAYLDYLRAKTKVSDVSSISARLDNASLFEVNDVDILNNVLERDPACSAAVRMRSDAGYHITMIASALLADVTYTVKWSMTSNLDASAKIAAVQNLAVELGLDGASVSEQSIEAKGLYWGIMDDAFLAHLSEPGAITPVSPESRRVIGAQLTPHLDLRPDVD